MMAQQGRAKVNYSEESSRGLLVVSQKARFLGDDRILFAPSQDGWRARDYASTIAIGVEWCAIGLNEFLEVGECWSLIGSKIDITSQCALETTVRSVPPGRRRELIEEVPYSITGKC